MSPARFIVVLRPFGGEIIVHAVHAAELVSGPRASIFIAPRHHDPQTRSLEMEMPPRTRAAQLAVALELIEPDERAQLYHLAGRMLG